jgi:Protein of unknown function (DUF2516)
VGVATLNHLYFWTDQILFWGLVALRVWAIADCATRKTAAFPAVGKLTKPAWLAILVVAGFLGSYLSPPLGLFSLISAVASAVYLADVRPAVREISGGSR